MQPNQPDSLPPVDPTPPPEPAPTPPPPQPASKHSMPKWIWAIIAVAIVLVGLAIYLIVSLAMMSKPQAQHASNELTKLTVGSQPYIYPCAVATEADYAQIFKFDDPSVGTVSETSALPIKYIKADTSDLTKVALEPSNRYESSCSFTLAKAGATKITRMDVAIRQYADEKEAKSSYASLRNTDAGDYTNDDVDNGLRHLTTLPSFPESSYVRLPEDSNIILGLKAVFMSGTRIISLEYDLGPSETTDMILPLMDQFAKSIQSKINGYKEGKPVDLTGRATFVGKKFVSVCYQADLAKLAGAFGDIQFRPDSTDTSATYGTLTGSLAALEGAKSYCKLDFNTSGDRKAQTSRKSSSKLYADKTWPHGLTLIVNSFRTADDAKSYLAAKKANATKSLQFGGGTPVIEDVVGIGDAAYTSHKESTLGGQQSQSTTIEDTLSVASGSDVITISTQQSANALYYQTVPLQITEAKAKKAYELVRDTLAQQRK